MYVVWRDSWLIVMCDHWGMRRKKVYMRRRSLIEGGWSEARGKKTKFFSLRKIKIKKKKKGVWLVIGLQSGSPDGLAKWPGQIAPRLREYLYYPTTIESSRVFSFRLHWSTGFFFFSQFLYSDSYCHSKRKKNKIVIGIYRSHVCMYVYMIVFFFIERVIFIREIKECWIKVW